MAERRMFAKRIIDSDMFIDMPATARLLYYDLSMRADDDGFIDNPKKIARMTGASQDDLAILCSKQFVIPFETGIVVIKHWKIHNYIQKDRYKKTLHTDEFSRLKADEAGTYDIKTDSEMLPEADESSDVSSLDTECIQDVSNMDTQVRLGKSKDSLELGKCSLGKSEIDGNAEATASAKPHKHKYGMYNNVLLTDAELEKLNAEFTDLDVRIDRLSEYMASTGRSYKSHYATIKAWARKDSDRPAQASTPTVQPKQGAYKPTAENNFGMIPSNTDLDEMVRLAEQRTKDFFGV